MSAHPTPSTTQILSFAVNTRTYDAMYNECETQTFMTFINALIEKIGFCKTKPYHLFLMKNWQALLMC